jgi:hypothetical protein
MLGVAKKRPLAATMLGLAMAAPTARAAKADACAPQAAVSVEVAPLQLSDPPEKPERFYPQAARRDGVTGHVVLQCNAAGGALAPCAVDEETPPDGGFGASALKLAKSLAVRTAAVAQIVKVDVRFDLEPPGGGACRPGETSATR